MITPRFEVTQKDNFITIKVRAPYSSLRELDVDVDQTTFIFFCKPYYLRLNLPGQIVDDDRMKSSFDTNTGEFSFTCPKKNPGEYFKDLDLITKLLAPKVEVHSDSGYLPIEVLSQKQTEEYKSEKPLEPNHISYGFGFALRAHKDFVRISSEFDEVFEIDPSEVSLQDRHKLRIQHEQGKFNVDHYLADYNDDGEIDEILSLMCPYKTEDRSNFSKFTDKELDFLKNLPNIQYQLSDEHVNYCFNGLIDILFAYCYNRRTTYFEGSSESGWTLTKLASTLSWLDVFSSPKDVLVTAFRRSVIFPLFRHFGLTQIVFDDLKALIQLGEKCIIKALLEVYNIFLIGDCSRYILNNLFIKDYIVYVMNWDQDLWRARVSEVLSIEIRKKDLGLNLAEIEEGYNLHRKLVSLKILENDSDSDDTYCSSSEDSSDETSSSSESDTDSDDSTESVNETPA